MMYFGICKGCGGTPCDDRTGLCEGCEAEDRADNPQEYEDEDGAEDD